jgi:hypothetical protein
LASHRRLSKGDRDCIIGREHQRRQLMNAPAGIIAAFPGE